MFVESLVDIRFSKRVTCFFSDKGIRFISFDSVGVSAATLKVLSKLTCLSSERGDSSGIFNKQSFPDLNLNAFRGVSSGGPMSLSAKECRGATGGAVGSTYS